jgi:hypothetical protein
MDALKISFIFEHTSISATYTWCDANFIIRIWIRIRIHRALQMWLQQVPVQFDFFGMAKCMEIDRHTLHKHVKWYRYLLLNRVHLVGR